MSTNFVTLDGPELHMELNLNPRELSLEILSKNRGEGRMLWHVLQELLGTERAHLIVKVKTEQKEEKEKKEMDISWEDLGPGVLD